MKKRRYIPTWVIVLSAILASCAISGICCILIFKPELPHFPTAPQSQSEHIEDGGEPAPENNVGEGMETTSNSDTEPPEEESQLIEEPDAGNVQSEPSPHDSEVGAASGGKDESGELPSANKEDAGAATEPDTENQEAPLNGVVTDLGGVGEEEALINIYDRSIARGERCGYCWYGDSFFEAREQWQFFSGGRFHTAEELEQEESEWQNQQGF